MEMKDFEVGKKYKLPEWRQCWLICVGHTTKGVPIMEGTSGSVRTIDAWGDWKSLVEYREPREFWLLRGVVYTKKENIEKYAHRPIDEHEVIHVREVIE